MASTAPRSPPFRAEHLGSLLRPKELLTKRNAFEAGKISQAELSPVEDEAVKKTVKMQTDLGYRAISDGEYRYVSYLLPQQGTSKACFFSHHLILPPAY